MTDIHIVDLWEPVEVVEVAPIGIQGPAGPPGEPGTSGSGQIVAVAVSTIDVLVPSGAWFMGLGVSVTFDAIAGHSYLVMFAGGLYNGDPTPQVAYMAAFDSRHTEHLQVAGSGLTSAPTPGSVDYLNGQWTGTLPAGPATLRLGCYFAAGSNHKFLGSPATPAQLAVIDVTPGGPSAPPVTPWTTLPLEAPWTRYDLGPLQYRLVGTNLELRGRAVGPGMQYQRFGVLPVGFRPGVQEIVPAVGYYPAVAAWTGGGVFLDTNGDVMPLETADQWALSSSTSLLPQ